MVDMPENLNISGSSEGVSEHSEASFVERQQQAVEDITWLGELVEHGLTPDITGVQHSISHLERIEYDEFIPEQNEAKEHINAAIALLVTSYEKSVNFTVEEANRIITAYPDVVYPHYGVITSVAATWQRGGSAVLTFQTEQDQQT